MSGSGLTADFTTAAGAFQLTVQLTADAGQTVALLGPNASGKTTTLRCLAGLHPLTAGRITLNGIVLDDRATGEFVEPEQRRAGVVFQSYALFDHLSVRDNIAFGLRAIGTAKRRARCVADALIDRFELGDLADRRPAALSGGQSQRVAIARALAIEPRLLLLDEPLAALDIGTRRQIRRELRSVLSEFDGVRIIVTHDPVDAYALADQIVVLEQGQVIQRGTIAEITAHPQSAFVADLVGTNLVRGTVTGNTLSTEEGLAVRVSTPVRGNALATLRPQSITLTRSVVDSSARNIFDGTVVDIDRLGERARVAIEGDLALVAEITTAALDQLSLRPGDTIRAQVKATDIKVYPA